MSGQGGYAPVPGAGGYQPQGGGYAPQGPYPPQGAYPPQGGYQGGPPPAGGYPGAGQPPPSGGYPGAPPGGSYQGGGPPPAGAYPPQGGAPPPAGSVPKFSGEMPNEDVMDDPNSQEAQPTAPPMEKMDNIGGYSNVGFNANVLPPPSYEDVTKEQPPTERQAIQNVPTITEQDARESLLNFVSQHCCYGKGAAEDLKFLDLKSNSIIFKNNKTGKIDQYPGTDVEKVHWLKRARGHCLKFLLSNGTIHRYDGFKEGEFEKLAAFISKYYMVSLEKKDLSVKGWNWGIAHFTGNALEFDVDNKIGFEVPLSHVSHTTTAKQEVTLEFHPNDDAAVSLMELRFHIPPDPKDTEKDLVQEFYNNVLEKADIIQATGDALAVFTEVQCLTPRGRYDFKMYNTFLQLHGKTFDYKIPYTTVLRLFLLPHKDGRQMFFVISLDPPIKQGQTRYHFCILLFNIDDEMSIELGISDEDLQEKYENKLQKEMSGAEYEVISRVFKAVTNRKITVPGSFFSNTKSHSISCSYKAATGFLYPLERGFIFVHKPPIHIRFDEVVTVNFARSAGTNRSFDFDVETKSGTTYTFVGIEKDEYGKLYDFVTSKKLRVKNINGKGDKAPYRDDMSGSDDEDNHDAYLERMKAEGKDRQSGDEDDDSDSSDESYNPNESASDVAEEYDSNPPTTSSNSESGDSSGGSGDEEKQKKRKEKQEKKKSRSAKTVREKLPGSEKKKKKKSKKDPNAPKRPQSAYFLWFNANREELKKDNPDISITDLSKKAGEVWKQLEETDKTEWNEKAAEAKKEYEKAMEEYKAKKKEASDDEGDDDSSKKKKSPKKSPSKSLSDSRAGAGTNYKSKEYISSSGSNSSGSDSDDKPLKKKAKKDQGTKEKKKKEKAPETKRKSKRQNKGSESESSVGELPDEEEILDTPPSSGKSASESESD